MFEAFFGKFGSRGGCGFLQKDTLNCCMTALDTRTVQLREMAPFEAKTYIASRAI